MERCEQILQIIYDAIDEVNLSLNPNQSLEKFPETVLVGESGNLDSLGVVNLLVVVEENIARIFGEDIGLLEPILSTEGRKWTVATLASCIAEMIEARRPIS